MTINDTDIKVNRSTELLGVSTNGYYKWRNRLNEHSKDNDMEIRNETEHPAIEFPSYRYMRTTATLKNLGVC